MISSLFELPTLDEVFGQDVQLLNRLKRAGFDSLLPLMLLPERSLLSIKGIGPFSDARITTRITKQGLQRRSYDTKLASYLTRYCLAIEEAPVGVLDVAIVRNDEMNYPIYAPIAGVQLLKKIETNMMLIDVMQYDRQQLRYLLSGANPLSESVRDAREDASHIEARLTYLELGLTAKIPRLDRVG